MSTHKSLIERNKGKSLLEVPVDYTVVDIETTGFSSMYNEIIEIGCIKYRADKEVERYEKMIKPMRPIPYVISCMTGITNEMVKESPSFRDIGEELLAFLQGEIIIGHNVSFDINFLYDSFNREFGIELKNDFVDVLRLSRIVLPEIKNEGYSGYGLDNLCRYFQYLGESEENAERHRAMGDCIITNYIYSKLKKKIRDNQIELKIVSSKYINFNKVLKGLKAETENFDANNVFYGKCCVFTGQLEEFTRKEAAQIVVNIGGKCEDRVTQKTNFLIVGDMDYKKGLQGYESNKLRRAKQLISENQDLQIIPESAFYDLVEEYLGNE